MDTLNLNRTMERRIVHKTQEDGIMQKNVYLRNGTGKHKDCVD